MSGSPIEYDHAGNLRFHTVEGAVETLRTLFPQEFPKSVLDVGCGTGTWLKASADRGAEICGIDGIDLPAQLLAVPKSAVLRADLIGEFDLERRFDLVLCLETAEHLLPESARPLVESLTRHGDTILFSAAAPGQPGDHHINCQWPVYWQSLFNHQGFACSDAVRWEIWDNSAIEPWYRQNMMLAKSEPLRAGREPRIKGVIHPDLLPFYEETFFTKHVTKIENGAVPAKWYLTAPFKAAAAKARRYLRRPPSAY
jgi:SAM-dependent methyltransferase